MFLESSYIFSIIILLAYNTVSGATNCPLRFCFKPCASGYRLDSNGCMTCICLDPCETVSCNVGQTCKPYNAPCVKSPCYLIPRCIADCPKLICAKICEDGYRTDKKGCQTCMCLNPCENNPCREGQLCKSVVDDCDGQVCYTAAKCISMCPKIECPTSCAMRGYRKDSNGCQNCLCADACDGYTCDPGMECTLVKVPCDSTPCYPEATCTKKTCPVINSSNCALNCSSSGRQLDSKGCEMCRCMDQCDGQTCPAGRVCMPIQVYCDTKANCDKDFFACALTSNK